MKTSKLLFLLIFTLIANCCFAVTPDWQNDKLSIKTYTKKITDNKYNILIEFTLKNGWFISWDNPGDAGTPTSFLWQDKVKKINQSIPQTIIHEDILGQYGYSDKAYYLFEGNFFNDSTSVKINWEACKQECEQQSVQLKILFNDNNTQYDNHLTLAENTFPSNQIIEAKAELEHQNDNTFLNIYIDKPNTFFNASELYFIPYQKSIISVAKKQITLKSENQTLLSLQLDNPILPSQGGLLIDKDNAYKINLIPIKHNLDLSSLLYILLLSFLGGFILNFMPCVFPVLSLKAISYANLQQNKRGALLYLCGVISSFLSLAALLYILRQTGSAIGWGFQLQSPIFVFIMLIIFLILFLMILDIITISSKILNWFNKMGNMNSFMSGFFAVLIASPCTGPFLGAVLGYTLMQNPSIYFMIFISLSLGYALPLTLLELYPKSFSKLMPKSGKWTIILKYILSVPVFLTILWLAWILFHQLSNSADNNDTLHFKPYDETEIVSLINSGQPVFIEYTAKWCLTCLLNEKTVLNTKDFISFAKKNKILLYRADWTEQDPIIGQSIKSYSRNSVPLYVYYPPRQQNYILLPQILKLDNVKSVMVGQ